MKLKREELFRLAFVYAERDQDALADAWGRDTPEGKDAADIAAQFRAYRVKKWGKTRGEAIIEGMSTFSLPEVRLLKQSNSTTLAPQPEAANE